MMNTLLSDVEEEKGHYDISDVGQIDKAYTNVWIQYLKLIHKYQKLQLFIQLILKVFLNDQKLQKLLKCI